MCGRASVVSKHIHTQAHTGTVLHWQAHPEICWYSGFCVQKQSVWPYGPAAAEEHEEAFGYMPFSLNLTCGWHMLAETSHYAHIKTHTPTRTHTQWPVPTGDDEKALTKKTTDVSLFFMFCFCFVFLTHTHRMVEIALFRKTQFSFRPRSSGGRLQALPSNNPQHNAATSCRAMRRVGAFASLQLESPLPNLICSVDAETCTPFLFAEHVSFFGFERFTESTKKSLKGNKNKNN